MGRNIQDYCPVLVSSQIPRMNVNPPPTTSSKCNPGYYVGMLLKLAFSLDKIHNLMVKFTQILFCPDVSTGRFKKLFQALICDTSIIININPIESKHRNDP